ncbi:histone acetyltransferase type B catalytic subunit isoform X3 [Pseudoliparis swirei]|uniref:histone acetyltransferase type B catalytic subunit isoform X3 n=1 Tax=Pseudoliparis swirei TaxID=2059687 RepID=UPI0024BD8CBD|nr:histone acetyltransferase type B catalytic subunit isoform X3 [Pseudoliparis swirei]
MITCIHIVLPSQMISRERSGKSFPLGSPATLTTSSHCWRKRPISSPSALSFTRTLSTARRQENSRTRFTRHLFLPYSPQADITCPGFLEYHERLQTFLMWFIETASYIDADDDHWDFFLVFEKYKKDGETLYATVGYMTVYNYYVYPDKTRPRVSQMLILPPFQGEGHGAQLLEAVHRFYCSLPKVQDITAEDPSESYVKLRDYVLVKFCQGLQSFAVDKLHLGFSADMAKEAQDQLKINKKHARRVYEILRLRATDMSDEEKVREYRLEVKKRLFGPYRKNQRELTKMRKCLRPEELVSHMDQMDTQTQHEELEKSYQVVVEDYRRIIERIATQA